MKKVEIEWIDSKSGPNEWEYIDELEPLLPVICKTTGYILEETPDYKTIAHTVSNDQVVGRISIPNNCIRKVKKLK
jgi:hypothetical protein